MGAIYKREMRAYFTTPIGYVFLAAFIAANGVMFAYTTSLAALRGKYASVANYFSLLIISLVLLVPLLTMKIFSEERKTKTEQLLLTSPVSLSSIVLGKFLAAYTMFAIAAAVSFCNFIMLYVYSEPASAQLFGYIIAVMLIGAACIAIGTFISTLTENQLVSAIATMAVLLVIVCVSILNSSIHSSSVRTVLSWVSIIGRFYNFTNGIFDFSAVLYCLSLTGVFLLLSVRVFEHRRGN